MMIIIIVKHITITHTVIRATTGITSVLVDIPPPPPLSVDVSLFSVSIVAVAVIMLVGVVGWGVA